VVVKAVNVDVLDDSEGWVITGMSDKIEMKGGPSLSPFRDIKQFWTFPFVPFSLASFTPDQPN
jgi:hypothetical protein